MTSVHLLTGENAQELLQEKRRWIVSFEQKFGAENCSRLDSSVTVRNLLDEISVQPFLAEKRLIVVDGVPKMTKDEVQLLHNSIHPQNILLFVEAKPDKRTAGVKELLSTAEIRAFEPKTGASLRQWMQAYAASLGIRIAVPACDKLIEFTGEDQASLASELEKLAAYKPGGEVHADDVDLLGIPTEEGVVWKISDLLSTGSRQQAISYAHRLLDRGGDAYGLWAILTSMLKNLVYVFAADDSGMRSAADIAQATGVHPFAVRNLLKHAQRLKEEDLSSFVTWAAEMDLALKTGGLRSTDEAPQEILALVDEFLLRCP